MAINFTPLPHATVSNITCGFDLPSMRNMRDYFNAHEYGVANDSLEWNIPFYNGLTFRLRNIEKATRFTQKDVAEGDVELIFDTYDPPYDPYGKNNDGSTTFSFYVKDLKSGKTTATQNATFQYDDSGFTLLVIIIGIPIGIFSIIGLNLLMGHGCPESLCCKKPCCNEAKNSPNSDIAASEEGRLEKTRLLPKSINSSGLAKIGLFSNTKIPPPPITIPHEPILPSSSSQ